MRARRRPGLSRMVSVRVLRLACMLAAVAVLGEAGHQLFDQLNDVVAHHFFHIVFPLVAFAIFGLLVARDIRAHGWPTFTWRLEPIPSPSRLSSTYAARSTAQPSDVRNSASGIGRPTR